MVLESSTWTEISDTFLGNVPESEKVWSQLSAHLQPFFLAHCAYFNNFRQKIPYFDVLGQKRVLSNCFATKQCLGMLKCEVSLFFALSESYWISPCLSLALYGSLWLPLWLSLPLSDILWPSLAHYCYLISRIQALIGPQGPCSALIADATMTHFILLWLEQKRKYTFLSIFVKFYCQDGKTRQDNMDKKSLQSGILSQMKIDWVELALCTTFFISLDMFEM